MRQVTALAFVLSLLPALAQAACLERDLEGTYTLTSETRGVLGTFWTTCEIRIAADGSVRPGTACVQRDVAGTAASATVDGGAIVLARSCKITGNLSIAGYESVVTSARVSRDMRTVEGEGFNAADGSTIIFSASRVP